MEGVRVDRTYRFRYTVIKSDVEGGLCVCICECMEKISRDWVETGDVI